MVSNTTIQSCAGPADTWHPWNQPLLKLGLISQPLLGPTPGEVFLSGWSGRFIPDTSKRLFFALGISCFSFPARCKRVTPAGHQPRSVPFDEPGIDTASISYAGLIGDAGKTSKDRCLCTSEHSILAGTSEQTQDFVLFSTSKQRLPIPSIVVMC